MEEWEIVCVEVREIGTNGIIVDLVACEISGKLVMKDPVEQRLPHLRIIIGEVERNRLATVIGLEGFNLPMQTRRVALEEGGLDTIAIVVVRADVKIDDLIVLEHSAPWLECGIGAVSVAVLTV